MTHVYRLKQFLPKDTPIKSLVVFIKGNIKYIDAPVCNLRLLKREIKTPISTKTLNYRQMQYLASLIQKAIDSNQVTNREHIQEIKKMKKDIENNICPRCGGTLVLWHGQYGNFYGCSNYPKCSFKKKIDN